MKPVQRCRHCNRWRPDPYIKGEWISGDVSPPSVEYEWVTCEDCEGEHTREKEGGR